MILLVDHREPIPAVIPVTVAVMTPVRPVLLKTIPALYQLTPNAVRPANAVKTVHPAAGLIPDLMSDLPSAEAVMLVPIPAGRVRNPFPVLLLRTKSEFLPPNAVQAAIPANIIQIVPFHQNHVLTDALLTTPAANVPLANPLRLVRTRLTSAALTDARPIVPAALLVKPANLLR